jgi:hypothetical protein
MAFVAAAAIIGGTTLLGAYMSSSASKNAANQYANAANQGIDYSKQIYGDIKGMAQPYLNTGTQANNALNSMLPGQYTDASGNTQQGNGYLTAQPTMNDLTSLMPNYKFGLTQGMGQFNSQLNAGGGAVSGNAIQGGQQFAQDYAGNQLQNAFSNYQANRQNVASNIFNANNVGMNALGTVSNAGTGTASNVSNMLSSIGNAQASGTMGSANAYTSGLSNLSNYAMLYGMNKMNAAPVAPVV